MNNISIKLGNKIKEYRTDSHLTQEQLANQLGVCSRFIISLEKGQGNPRLDILYKISLKLNLSIDSLLMENETYQNEYFQKFLYELSCCTEDEIKSIYPIFHQILLALRAK